MMTRQRILTIYRRWPCAAAILVLSVFALPATATTLTDSQARNDLNGAQMPMTTVSAAMQMATWQTDCDRDQGSTNGRELVPPPAEAFIDGQALVVAEESISAADAYRGSGVFDSATSGPPRSQFAVNAWRNGTLSGLYAHLWQRDAATNSAADPMEQVGFLGANDVWKGKTNGQGLFAVVPEPLTMIQLAFGTSAIGGCLWRQLRRRCRKESPPSLH